MNHAIELADIVRHRLWVDQGTELVVRTADALSEEQLRDESLLPGWTRAHVVGHTARNAQGLGRLATWALTGEETLMYPSSEFREMQITETAEFTSGQLKELLGSTAHDLDHRFADLDAEQAWDRTVRTYQGTEVPASFIVWLRVREVWIHAVDLNAGVTFDDLPDELQAELLSDVATGMAARDGMPAISVSDGMRTWHFGDGTDPVAVTGSRPALLAWLLGRVGGAQKPLVDAPSLPRWV